MIRRVVALCSLMVAAVLVVELVVELVDHHDHRPIPRLVIVPPRPKLTIHCSGPDGGFPCYWSNGAPFPDGRSAP